MEKQAACMDDFSHSAVENDDLNENQSLRGEFYLVYEPSRRSNTTLDQFAFDFYSVSDVIFELHTTLGVGR